MTSHTPSFEINLSSMALASQLHLQTWSFTLSPDLWDQVRQPQKLDWLRVAFDETQACQIPNDLIGVYAFVLEPNVADLNLAYLMYVGQTTDSFRARFSKYKGHQREERTNRPLVKLMLTTWPGRMAFYYAPIDDPNIVESIEEELIAAFKPPACRRYPAKVSEPFRILDR